MQTKVHDHGRLTHPSEWHRASRMKQVRTGFMACRAALDPWGSHQSFASCWNLCTSAALTEDPAASAAGGLLRTQQTSAYAGL